MRERAVIFFWIEDDDDRLLGNGFRNLLFTEAIVVALSTLLQLLRDTRTL
jgi:hypothetical protein